jgi:hypothetical protein
LKRPKSYLGGDELGAGAIAELLLPSAGAAGVVLLSGVTAGAVAAGGGAGAGAGVLSVLLQAESTSAVAMTLRASFVFIDGSPKMLEKTTESVKRNTTTVGRIRLPNQ